MNRYIATILLALAFGTTSLVASTPDGTLVGYERRLQSLTQQEDLLSDRLNSLRTQINDGDTSAQSKYLNLEMELLALRAEVKAVENAILRLTWESPEQPQEEEIEPQSNEVVTLSSAKSFSGDSRYRKALSAEDFERLKSAEAGEQALLSQVNTYIANLHKVESLRNSYNKAKDEATANVYLKSYNDLLAKNRRNGEILIKTWSEIYDSKHFAHSYLLELHAPKSVADEIIDLRDARISRTAEWSDYPDHELLKRYVTEKEELLRLELLASKYLNIPHIEETVKGALPNLERLKVKYPTIDLTYRNFIVYERESFMRSHYYTARNPIPTTKVYQSGIIYRLYVGNFDKKQPTTMFRQTKPVSYHVEKDKSYTYYIGGYATFEDAQRAQLALRKQGFRKPQIVMWRDGVTRNLEHNPFKAESYRVEVKGVEALSAATQELFDKLAFSGVNVLRTGVEVYIISPISGEGAAMELTSKIKHLERSAKVDIRENN